MLASLNKSKACGRAGLLLLVWGVVCYPARMMAWGGDAAKRDRMHEVEQMEQRWRSAELAGDAEAMDHMLSDDYVSVTMQGKVNTKAQQLRRMRDRQLVLDRMDLSDVKIHLSGDIAIVTGHANILGRSSELSLNGNYRYTQVLHQMPNGTWTITNFEARRLPSHAMPLLALARTPHAS